ncbi:hypothetical protein FOC47_27375 [Enterocloster clostridioformis]|uniref:Uncharacterized protein n=1 Tax=Enterocloster clostridioformis TaxID=1531 RepID=A0AAP9M4D4_9FIRM|nr:hypothetical protein [Enterocloster clostridioformis]QIX93933.1 hypothetical protein FOC47_27375 [Enterocloster clostridioformis]
MEERRIDWFTEIADRLRDYSEGEIWSSGNEILCRTESAVNTLVDMLETLYHAQGEMENEWLHHEMHVYREEGINIWEDIMRRKAYDKKNR